MQSWKYFVQFKAADNVDAQMAIKERLLPIEGTAIDTSVNANKWQVPPEDLDFFVSTLQGSQLRIDHAESAMAVIGKVPKANRLGDTVQFRAEIGDLPIIEKVLRGYLSHVSVQVDSDDVQCSQCGQQTRKEGILVHLCPNAWEIVHKPRVRELSIVASPAYKNTEFKPLGFAAAMDAWQTSYSAANLTLDNNKWVLKQRLLGISKTLLSERLERLNEFHQEVLEVERSDLQTRLLKVACTIAKAPKNWADEMRSEAGLENAPPFALAALGGLHVAEKGLSDTSLGLPDARKLEQKRQRPWIFDLDDGAGVHRVVES
jgi:hypothetical protein